MNMRRRFCRLSWLICLMFAVLPPALWAASTADDVQADPHWKRGTCDACHLDAVPGTENHSLNMAEAEAICDSCHGARGEARHCPHVSDVSAAAFTVPENYAEFLHGDQLVCTTCHDLTVQCLSPSKSYSFMNPGFVRDRSSPDSSEQCYLCHESPGLDKINPHVQEAGDTMQATCLMCHATAPRPNAGTGWQPVDFNMKDEMNDACRGCHRVRPHPGSTFSAGPIGWDHLVRPLGEFREKMRLKAEQTGAKFPLDPYDGKIYCATCHNPHDETLQGYAAVVPAPSRNRLRINDICQACHDK